MASGAKNALKVFAGIVGATYASQTRIKIETEHVKIENDGLDKEMAPKMFDSGVKIVTGGILSDVMNGDNLPGGGKQD